MTGSVPCTGYILSETHWCWENWYRAKGKIRQHFQGCILPSCVSRVYFLYNSTEFNYMRTEFQRKNIIIHLLLYSFFNRSPITCAQICLLTNHTPPNILLPDCSICNAHSPITLPPNHMLPYCSLDTTHPVPSLLLSNFLPDRLISLPNIFEK